MRNFPCKTRKATRSKFSQANHPTRAALKAANRGHTDIRLRERSTKKVHMFAGERVQVDKPKGAPAWMKDRIWKPQVKKIGVEKLEQRRKPRSGKVSGISNLIQSPLFPELELLLAVHPVAAVTIRLVL